MLEYAPMINSRAHKIGHNQTKRILNRTLRQTYDQFLQTMAQKISLSLSDHLALVYYLQLQDRIEEAIKVFSALSLQQANFEGDLKIQFDYLQAYFDFFNENDFEYLTAKRIVQQYDNYPVSHWRMMFLQIEDQLNDLSGEFDQMDNEADQMDDNVKSESDLSLKIAEKKQAQMRQSKQREPNLAQVEVDADTGKVTVEAVNVAQVQVKYYQIDAELLFSRSPFLKNNAQEFSYVAPCHTQTLNLFDAAAASDEIKQTHQTQEAQLPEQLAGKNLVIEITGEGKQVFKTFYSSKLKVQILESFGELKVMPKKATDQQKALSRVYVKVFSKDANGKESFFKDGYTDIRGKFEYANGSSAEKLKLVKKFAILVHDDAFGSEISEVNPPKSEYEAPVHAYGNDMFGMSSAANYGGNMTQMRKEQRTEQRYMNRASN